MPLLKFKLIIITELVHIELLCSRVYCDADQVEEIHQLGYHNINETKIRNNLLFKDIWESNKITSCKDKQNMSCDIYPRRSSLSWVQNTAPKPQRYLLLALIRWCFLFLRESNMSISQYQDLSLEWNCSHSGAQTIGHHECPFRSPNRLFLEALFSFNIGSIVFLIFLEARWFAYFT